MVDAILNNMTCMYLTPLASLGAYLSVPLSILGATILVSFIAVKIGSVALRMTGLKRRTAFFQALSAFTGTGFTTRESEKIVAHGGRRKIVQILIISGNVGLATAIVTAIQAFNSTTGGAESQQLIGIAFVLVVVGAIVYYFAVAKRLERWLDHIIENRLERFTDLELADFEEVLKLSRNTGIAKIEVHEGNPILGKALKDLGLSRAGLLVLALERKNELLPAPAADTIIQPGDRVVCYGASDLARAVAHGEFVPPDPDPCAYQQLLTLDRSYGISSVLVDSGGCLDGRSLKELHLPSRRILVLAIHCGPDFIPAPNANTLVVGGDRLVCYGPSEAVCGLTAEGGVESSEEGDTNSPQAVESSMHEEEAETNSKEMTA